MSVIVDSAKLNWAFKLYDVDNDGLIDLEEMSIIMETLDSIEGIKPGALASNPRNSFSVFF